MVTIKTFAKLVAVAVGTVAAIAAADKIIDKIDVRVDKDRENMDATESAQDVVKAETNADIADSKRTVKNAVNYFIIFMVASKLAIKFYARGLQSGVIYGAVSAAKNNAAMDDVRRVVLDDGAFSSLMNEVGKVVRI